VAVEAAAVRKAARAEAVKTPERNVESLRRTAERDATAREKEVHRLEARVAELEAALADQALYSGGAEGSKKARKIDTELKDARRAHDEALTRWTAAMETVSALARS
jgi:t-SNARE complex subunit (syntaxin)